MLRRGFNRWSKGQRETKKKKVEGEGRSRGGLGEVWMGWAEYDGGFLTSWDCLEEEIGIGMGLFNGNFREMPPPNVHLKSARVNLIRGKRES